MDSKKFFTEIRKIIKEEIHLALKKKDVDNITPITDFKKDISHGMKLQNEVRNHTNSNVIKPTLQDLLNETRTEMLNGDKTISFTSVDAQTFGYGDFRRPQPAIPTVDIDGRPVQNLNPSLATALTKNYSELMKVIKDKKK